MKFNEIIARAFRAKDGQRAALKVRNAEEDGSVEVLLYDQIGFWGITAEEFKRELNAIDADTIHLRIDSPGGDVFMARAMKTALEQHKAKVIAHVDGLAASAASYIMLGADEIEVAKGAFIMIHNAWMITLGDTRDHAASAQMLDKIDGSIRADYAQKTGKPAEEFRQLMDDETWLDADEALEMGLIDRVYEKDGGAENRFDVSIFENAPDALTKPAEPEPDWAATIAAHQRRLEFFERCAP
ncbi:head maturation protease, ClpP-related [Roseovarius sp. MMSF_3350]|uniref:head maturation protease, ClpP-related n=1 Tax=Roseovarius sp. MMSF_3350 TaxID=3046706 RepID=UPI00273D6B94|nr:head maturation protease, ClpP-related [Roseovarius sp. MMSF_3350]